MDGETFPTLTKLSIRCAVANLTRICKSVPPEIVFDDKLDVFPSNWSALQFPDGFLPPSVADPLLDAVLHSSDLERAAQHLSPFVDRTKCRLAKLHIRALDRRLPLEYRHVIATLLRSHDFVEIQLAGDGDVIEPQWSLSLAYVPFRNLLSLDLSHSRFAQSEYRLLANAVQLRRLNLSYTLVQASVVNSVIEFLSRLEVLELYGCERVLGTLEMLRFKPVSKTLKYLNVGGTSHTDRVNKVIGGLEALQHLDVSGNGNWTTPPIDFTELMTLPSLVSLDLSMTTMIRRDFERFLEEKGDTLQFLGLVRTLAGSEMRSRDFPSHITVAGDATLEQLRATFHTPRYIQTPNIMQPALIALYHFLKDGDAGDEEPDLTRIVVKVSDFHSSDYGLQLAASACLIHLFSNLAGAPKWNFVIELALRHIIKMLEWRRKINENQLHLNLYIFLVRFSDEYANRRHVLPRLARVLAKKLRVTLLDNPQYEEIQRRAAGALRSLVYKCDTEGRTIFGEEGVVEVIKNIIAHKVDTKTSDAELAHLLSSIWSLTDENIPNCELFAKGTFVDDMLNLFKVCEGNDLHLKIHGGLGNLLEAPQCRQALMRDDYFKSFVDILRDDSIELAFKFDAAHALVNLAMLGEDAWTLNVISYSDALSLVANNMKHWPIPSDLRCAYRSFTSQVGLIDESTEPEVLLYALWAMCNFCYYDPDRYVPMLERDGAVPLVRKFLPPSGVREGMNVEAPWTVQSVVVKLDELLLLRSVGNEQFAEK